MPKQVNNGVNTPRLLAKYREDIAPKLADEFGIKNPMAVPKLVKVVVSVGLGEVLNNRNATQAVQKDLALITGQKPGTRLAKKSISNFGLRKGQPIGQMVTLRHNRMWYFLDRLINIALPRVRDFRGLSTKSFDGQGNFSLGLRDQVIFPEIDYNEIDKLRGFQTTIVTSTADDHRSLRLLELLGAPFANRIGNEAKN